MTVPAHTNPEEHRFYTCPNECVAINHPGREHEDWLADSKYEGAEDRVPLWLRWWAFKAWFHRCPECGHRPDRHYANTGPHWADDRVAQMLGIANYGCPRCGEGAIAERDADQANGATS